MQRTARAFGAPAHRVTGGLRREQRFQSGKKLRVLRLARGTAATRGADALSRALGQAGLEFAAAAPNGAAAQAGDLRQQRLPAPANTPRLKGHEPAALLLIEPADKQVDLLVQHLIGVRLIGPAARARTRVDGGRGHWSLRSQGMRCLGNPPTDNLNT